MTRSAPAPRYGDTRRVQRRRIDGHSPYEPIYGHCRAVVVGDHVYVSGTAPIPRDRADPPEDAYGQTKLCLEIILGALAEAGASPEDVVRTRAFLTRAGDFDEVARAHGEVFGDIRPAAAAVVVKELMDPRWRVEIEADALIGSAAGKIST
jgi:enamine deaminase RidA (YjgF/YER057c/UK114 family)